MRRVAAEHEYMYGRTLTNTHPRKTTSQPWSSRSSACNRRQRLSKSGARWASSSNTRTMPSPICTSKTQGERERDVLSPTVAPLNSVFRADIHLDDIFPEQNVGRRAAQHPGSEPVAPVGRAPHAGRDCCQRPEQRVPGRRRHVEQSAINCRPA